ncbi:ABC transporter permease [Tissierellaceae bacterium HCP3S3_D8]
MRDFFTVLEFELMNFLKNKIFISSTLIICLILTIVLSIPTIKNTFFSSSQEQINNEEIVQEEVIDSSKVYGYIDENMVVKDIEELESNFPNGKLVPVKDISELEQRVNSGEFSAGYIIKAPTKYEYVIKNNEMFDVNRFGFEEAFKTYYRIQELKDRGIDYGEVKDLIEPNIEVETKVLGKDSASNYFYTYILVFGLYFMIILYGQLIATSVASEKSNRAMEVLITSTKSTNLIFGKVLGGALAGVIQFGLIIFTGLITYSLNAAAWNNKLDFIFKIPANVLVTFSIFGILGYLFYSFIFGALGALVSRTEDISVSSTPVTIMFVVVFMISIIGMQNTEGTILKIASFVPLSSFMAMFVRVSMGTVSNLEVIISLGILALSTALIGFIASKIYRMGTLMYGNPVKLKDAIKILKSE